MVHRPNFESLPRQITAHRAVCGPRLLINPTQVDFLFRVRDEKHGVEVWIFLVWFPTTDPLPFPSNHVVPRKEAFVILLDSSLRSTIWTIQQPHRI